MIQLYKKDVDLPFLSQLLTTLFTYYTQDLNKKTTPSPSEIRHTRPTPAEKGNPIKYSGTQRAPDVTR